MVRKYHPESGHPESCPVKFAEVDEAFRRLMEKFAKERHEVYNESNEEFREKVNVRIHKRIIIENNRLIIFNLGNKKKKKIASPLVSSG